MFSNLNEPQLEAVQTTEGPLLVLAGAGTGKTSVLTSRIINILHKNLATPHEILAVTFTNKAAAEMKERIAAKIGDASLNLWIGTFHSIAAKILRRHAEIVGLKSDFTIIDQDDQLRLIKQIMADENIDAKQFLPKNYLHKISHAKDVKLGEKSLSDKLFGDDDASLPKLNSVFASYQNRLKIMNSVDFGDLLALNLEVFAKSPETLAYYQEKFRYILVDEYQDTNNVQYSWLRKFAAKRQNLCAVGDDDQSIYSWRGANVANILRFEKDFAGAKVIRLEQNYRSTAAILKAADSVISNNEERHKKTLWTDKGEGEKVKFYSFVDDKNEASEVVHMIQKALKNGVKAKEIAILVRAGFQTRLFEEALIRQSIAYKIIGGMKFYERMEVKDSICYLRIASNYSDDLAFLRIINTPKRGVGKSTIDNLIIASRAQNCPIFQATKNALAEGEIKGKARTSLAELVDLIEETHDLIAKGNHDLTEIAHAILEKSGYVKSYQDENSLEAQGRLENIDEFCASLKDFENITEFLEYVSLVEAKEEKFGQDSVSLMTIHGAKGLEFDLVFVVGMEDGTFPSKRSLDERNGEEEERRLCYVAITRAKKELVLTNAKSRFVFGEFQHTIPSRFVRELADDVEMIDNSYEQDYSHLQSGFGSQFGGNRGSYGGGNYGGSSGFGAKKSYGGYDGGATRQTNSRFGKFGVKSGGFGGSVGGSNKPAFGKASDYFAGKIETKAKKEYNQSDEFSGKRIFHKKFGYGKVVSADGDKLSIKFEKGGDKTLMKDFVSLA